VIESDSILTFRISSLQWLLGILAVIFIGTTLLPVPSGKSPLPSHVLEIILGLLIAILALCSHLYTVCIESGAVKVRVFRTRSFLLSDVADIAIVTGRGNAKSGVITLKDGKRFYISGFVTGFMELMNELNTRTGRARVAE
jgi:hypothetical protein